MFDQLDTFGVSCYRIMMTISRKGHVTNASIYQTMNEYPVSNYKSKAAEMARTHSEA